MNWLQRIFARRQIYDDLSEEIRAHLDEKVEELVAAGMPREQAEHAARREFGNVLLTEERSREIWRWPFLEDFLLDLRYALRLLHKSPGFAIVAALTLALGIGANTAIFSVIDAAMLRMLPVNYPQELVFVALQGKRSGQSAVSEGFSYPQFVALRRDNRVFTGLLAFWGGYRGIVDAHAGDLNSTAANESLDVEMVSPNYFSVLGVNAAKGRTLTPDEEKGPRAESVAVISYGLWKQLYGGEAAILGKKITIRHTPLTIIGVAPAHFHGVRSGRDCEVWFPVSMQPQIEPGLSLTNNASTWLDLIGRLKPGVSIGEARASLDLLYQQIRQQQGISKSSTQSRQGVFTPHILLLPAAHGTNYLRAQFREPLLLLMGMVALVLLIACANVSSLLLARASARQPEMAVRLALGAGPRRLMRQLLTESVLLALIGAALGILFAYWGSPLLVILMSHRSLVPGWDQFALNVHPDLRVLVFTVLIAVVAGCAFGLAPALRATRVAGGLVPQQLTTTRASRRLGGMLVSAQVALTLVMVIGAGLLIGTFYNLETLNPGFNRHNVLLFSFRPGKVGYAGQRAVDLRREVLNGLRRMPGVRSASCSFVTPIGGGYFRDFLTFVEGHTPSPGEDTHVYLNVVDPQFFRTLSIPILRGRDFGFQDHMGSTAVVLINQIMAHRFFGASNPIGKHIRFGQLRNPKHGFEVIGVVQNAKRVSLRAQQVPVAYFYLPQISGGLSRFPVTFEVRSSVPPFSLLPGVRRLMEKVDSRLAPTTVRTFSEQVDWSLTREKMMSALSLFFGVLVLVLACVGLYGLASYAAARRTKEIGIRMALGAERHDILLLVMGEGLRSALIGIAIGLPAAWAATRFIAGILYGLKATNLLTNLGAALLLASVAVFAGYLPARRATAVDPMTVLRNE